MYQQHTWFSYNVSINRYQNCREQYNFVIQQLLIQLIFVNHLPLRPYIPSSSLSYAALSQRY